MADKILLKLKKLSNKKIKTGENLKEILAYRGISLWWFIEHSVYLRLKGRKGRKITGKKFLINFICFFMKMFFISKLLFRKVAVALIKIKPKHPNREKIMVCSSLWHWRSIQDPVTLKTRKGDVILGNIIDALKRDGFQVLGLDRDDSHLIDVKRFFNKLIHGQETWRPIETYLTFNIIKTAFEESKKLENKWKNFLQYSLSEDKKLFNRLSDDFKIFFTYHIFQAILYMEVAKRAIEIEKPKLIVVAGEHANSGRSIVALGRLKDIPTLAVQHGFHTHSNVMYYNDPKEVSDKISSQYHPISDKFVVYGPWIKNILVQEFGHPKKRIVVTGQPRYDILKKAENIFSRERFCQRFGIDSKKLLVLINTQPFSFERRETFLRTLLKELEKIKNIEIVIKPHPVEDEKWHKKIAKEEDVRVIVLPRASNTYEALYACDVMITVSSTTVLEAMILDKDVIIANLIKDPSASIFARGGGAVSVKERKDLTTTVKKTLYNKRIKEKLKKGRKRFVYQHTYKQDGKATERVINLIKKMIDKSKGG